MHRAVLSLGEFFRAEIAAQKESYVVWWPVFLAFGIGAYFSLDFEPPLVFGVVGCGISLAVLQFFAGRAFAQRGVFLIVLVCVGFLSAQVRTMLVQTPILERELSYAAIEGVVEQAESLGLEQGSRLVLSDVRIEKIAPERTPLKIRLRVRKDEGVRAGQRVRITGRLMPPSPPVLPGGFDFQRYMFFRQIGAVGFAFSAPEILDEPLAGGVGSWLSNMRADVSARVREALPPRTAGIAVALLTAERAGMNEDDKEAMRDAGLAHLLAISGLHIGLFSGVVFFSVRLLLALIPGVALSRPIKRYAAVAAFCAAFFYAALAGFPVPTQRALIMIGVVFLGIVLDRWPFSLRLVAFAAFFVLLFRPESLVSVSFQLSFAAVTGLILFFEWLQPYSRRWYRSAGWGRRFVLYFLGVVMTTLIATVMTAPLSLYHFGQVGLFGIFANVIAVPVMAFVIMPAAVMSLFLMVFGVEGWTLWIMDAGIDHVLDAAYWFSSVPGAVARLWALPLSFLVLSVFGSLVLFLWRGWLRVLSVPFFVFAMYSVVIYRPYDGLVSSDVSLAGVRNGAGEIVLSSGWKEKFVAEKWMSYYGREDEGPLVWPKEGAAHGFVCDGDVCRFDAKPHKISFVFKIDAVPQECLWADVIVVFDYGPKRGCGRGGALMIDKRAARNDGAHGLIFDRDGDGALMVVTDREKRGVRPWVKL